MAKKPVIALLGPLQNAYSETFIQAHKHYLYGDVKYFFGGWLPNQLEGFGYLSQLRPIKPLIVRIGYKIWNKITHASLSSVETLKEEDLKRAFIKYRINVAFAEYGPTAAHCLKVCKELGIPLIVHFHGFDASEKDIIEKYATSYLNVFEYSKYIIGVSKKMVHDLSELGAPQKKLVYNPYGPNDAFFSICPNPKSKKFFSVGRFVEKKAPHLMLLAFKKTLLEHPDAVLYMGGDGPLWNACKDLAEACKMKQQVFFLGKLSPEQVRENMADSIAYVQHSVTAVNGDSEGSPVAIIEAGAAGLPVISTLHAGIPDIVINCETGLLVNEKDVDSMASCMSKIARDFDFAKTMGCAAKKRIKENFTMGKHIAILNQMIDKVLT